MQSKERTLSSSKIGKKSESSTTKRRKRKNENELEAKAKRGERESVEDVPTPHSAPAALSFPSSSPLSLSGFKPGDPSPNPPMPTPLIKILGIDVRPVFSARAARYFCPSSIWSNSRTVYFAPFWSRRALAFLQKGQPDQLKTMVFPLAEEMAASTLEA